MLAPLLAINPILIAENSGFTAHSRKSSKRLCQAGLTPSTQYAERQPCCKLASAVSASQLGGIRQAQRRNLSQLGP